MVKISHGLNNLTLSQITDRHWNSINPVVTGGSFHKTQSLVGRIKKLLQKHLRDGRDGEAKFYRILLDNNCLFTRRIVTCDVNELPNVIDEVTELVKYCNLFDTNKINQNFSYELLNEVFQYDNWRINGNANNLFELIDLNVCPYCNLAHVFFDDDAEKLIVSYDHYYDKGTYPYLALTFSNLIPACSICNQNYKLIFPFKIETHLHPYKDDYNTRCKFGFRYTEFAEKSNIVIDVIADSDIRSSRYNSDFSLAARYNLDDIKDNMKTIYHMSKIYDETYKNSMLALSGLQTLEQVEKEICNTLNIPFHPEEIRKKQYGKLKRDIAMDTGLLTTQL